MSIDSVNQNQGLYFAAAQSANLEALKAKQKEKTIQAKKKPFMSALQKSHEEHELMAAGLPKEIAGMEPEDAVVYLKDAADIAADKLKESMLPENFANYRQKVTQFLRYITKNNFTVKQYMHYRSNPKRRIKLNPHVQIVVINQKLDDIARWLIASHNDTLRLLAKIDEINGLLVDLMAT